MSDLSNLASELDGSTAQTITFKLQLVESKETLKRQPQTKQNCCFQVCLHHRSFMTIDHLRVKMRDPLRTFNVAWRHNTTPAACASIPGSSIA